MEQTGGMADDMDLQEEEITEEAVGTEGYGMDEQGDFDDMQEQRNFGQMRPSFRGPGQQGPRFPGPFQQRFNGPRLGMGMN